jgi:peptidoglycan hydrolase-like protein with peptidoglycan-binding domain
MTIAKDFASKAAIAFVAVAMIFSMFAPSVKAAETTEDLQAMINTLLAQIAALQGQAGGSTAGAAGVCPYTWTRDLNVGATGADVKMLQMFLNANADTRVAATGAGSAGMETETYGPATAAAVSKFQVMHRADILTPAGLVNPTGYFGPSTRAKANAACAAAPVVVPDTDEDEDGEEVSGDLQGEASLKDVTIDSASDDELEEGAEDAEVAEVTVEFENGDAEISRLDVAFDNSGVDMWDVLETVSLWVDGDMVAEMNADDEDEYQNDEATLRFSGLNIFAAEDEEVDIVVAVTLQNNIDSDDLSATSGNFNVSVDEIRFFDADGVATTEDGVGELTTNVTFTVEEAGSEDEVIVKTSSSDPDATTLKVEDDKKSDWYTVFVFDLDTDDSVNDIEFDGVEVTLKTSIAYGTLVDDVELVIDGVTIDDVTASTSVNGLVTDLVFDVDGDVTIDAGDRVAAELMVRFKSLALVNEGSTVQGLVTAGQADEIDAEGADTLGTSQLSGAATGDVHTLRTTGIDVDAKSESAIVTTSDGALNDYATYKITVDVTAFDQDVFIPIASASTSWSLVDSAGVAISPAPATASTSVVMTSSADVGGAGNAFFEINEGETETVTITVTFTPSIANTAAGLQLNSLLFDETGTVTGTDDQTWSATPSVDYRTDVVTIVN